MSSSSELSQKLLKVSSALELALDQLKLCICAIRHMEAAACRVRHLELEPAFLANATISAR